VVLVFSECQVPDSLILVCCGWEFWVLSVPCMLQSPGVTLLQLLEVREVGRRASSAAGGRTQTRKGKGPVDGLTRIVSAA
jgi:hypothetical protein